MKKNIGLIGLMAVLCLVLVVLCSCGDAPPETSDTETSSVESTITKLICYEPKWEMYREYIADLDSDRLPLPSFEELRAVTVNMPFSEATALLGKPQRTEIRDVRKVPTSLFKAESTLAVYETSDGILVEVAYASYVTYMDYHESEPFVYYIQYIYPDGTSEEFWAAGKHI